MKQTILSNAHIVAKDRDFNGSVIIEGNRIIDIKKDKNFSSGIDINNSFLIPGIIDIHSDYLEKEINPRPNTSFPIDLALRYLDYRAITCGITTLYNGVSFREDEGTNRSVELSLDMSEQIEEYVNKHLFLIRHFIHARLDTTTEKNLEVLDKINDYFSLKMAVFNDHTPGIRQFRDLKKYTDYSSDRSGLNAAQLLDMVTIKKQKALDTLHVRPKLAEKLKKHSIVLGSHDDTILEHIDESIENGCTLAEFPTTIEAARYAKEKGMTIAMGATNLVIGKSQSGNISCRDAMKENLVDILCSDYHLPSMLSGFLLLSKNGYTFSNAINFITYNPSRLLKIDDELGSIDIGKNADLVVFNIIKGQPFIENIFIDGEIKFNCRNPEIQKDLCKA